MNDTLIDKEKAIEIAQKYKAVVVKHLPLKGSLPLWLIQQRQSYRGHQ